MKKRKHKIKTKHIRTEGEVKRKNMYDIIGLSPEVIANEPKIVLTGDFFISFYNHKGIVDITDTKIRINTKKAIYIITGAELFISAMTDDEISVSGKIISLEREL